MSFLNQMRISWRLALIFGLLILLLILIGGYGATSANRLSKSLDRTAKSSLVKIAAVQGLEAQVSILARASRDLLLLDAANQIKRQQAAIDGALEETTKQFAKLDEAADNDDERTLLAQMKERKEKLVAAVSKFRGVQKNGSPDEARESLIADIRPAQTAYQESLKGMVEMQFKTASSLAEDGADVANTATLVTVVLLVAAVVIGVGGGLAISGTILRPVRSAQLAAEAIRSGDLTHEIRTEGNDELSQMLHSMQEMQSALSGVLASVNAAATEVSSNATAIATSNQDLSERTSRSAGNLQTTAASVEQIAANLSGASELTRKAAAIATQARSSASAGGTVVNQVVQTMQEISASSRKIGDIIGVIDGIAFQTNILALNAAVEAARAGEHGRGFAVVASEVRALASRAADAAKEIKVLISESTVKVENGTTLVNNAGATIREVVDEVNNMGQLIEEISLSAQEQAGGVSVVNQAMNELDRSTQQNAGLVSELNRSTGALTDSSARLLDAVAYFRTHN